MAERYAFGADEIVVTIDLLLLFEVYFGAPMAPPFLIRPRWDLPSKPLLVFLINWPDDVVFVPDLDAFHTFTEVGILDAEGLLVLLVAVLTKKRHFSPIFCKLGPGAEDFPHFQEGLDFIHLLFDSLLLRLLFEELLQDGETFLLDADLVHLPHDLTLAERLPLQCPKIFPDQNLLVESESQVMHIAALLEAVDLLFLQVVEVLEPIDVVFARWFVVLPNLLLMQILLDLFLEVQELLILLILRYRFHLTSGILDLIFFLLLLYDEFMFRVALLYGHVPSRSRCLLLPRILLDLLVLVVTFL